MWKSLKYLVAVLVLAAWCSGFCASAQPLGGMETGLVPLYGGRFASAELSMPRTASTGECAYVDYLHRPRRSGAIDDLLGPIGQVKNGPYAAWTTKIAYLSVTGSMKFQSSRFVNDTWKLYPSTYDRYDFILGQAAQKFVTFRLSGSYSMTGIKLLASDKVAHCYNVGIRPELMLNSIRCYRDGVGTLTASALAGPEFGVLFSMDNWNLQARFYAGVTGAVRLDYAFSDRFCLYFEPRLSYVPFTLRSFSGNTGATRVGNAFGSVTRLNLGFRISF